MENKQSDKQDSISCIGAPFAKREREYREEYGEILTNYPFTNKIKTNIIEDIKTSVNFEFDSALVSNHADHDIQKFADFLSTYSNYNANIVGHTDNFGPSSYNQVLSTI